MLNVEENAGDLIRGKEAITSLGPEVKVGLAERIIGTELAVPQDRSQKFNT